MSLTLDWILFFALGVVAIGSALGMLMSRNAVYSALFLVLNFATVAVFFLLLGAPFIAMMQVTVYAGAIMVLFLFVIMLLGAEMLRQPSEQLQWHLPVMFTLGLLFVGALAVVLLEHGVGPLLTSTDIAQDFGGPQMIGATLFQDYALPFELTSFLLLLGMIGAVVLVKEEKKPNPKSQEPTPKA